MESHWHFLCESKPFSQRPTHDSEGGKSSETESAAVCSANSNSFLDKDIKSDYNSHEALTVFQWDNGKHFSL